MIKKTAYDLAGIQIRPAIQNLNTGEYIIYRSSGEESSVRQVSFTEWLRSLFQSNPKRR